MKRIAIVGAGELGTLLRYHLEQQDGWEVVGFYDDYRQETEFDSLPVLGKVADAEEQYQQQKIEGLFMGIGYNAMAARAKLFEKWHPIIPFPSFIHSSVVVEKSAEIGDGVVLLPGVVLDHAVKIKNNVLLNTGCVVAHHSTINDHTFMGPGVTLAGRIEIGKRCFIGVGSTIKDMIEVEDDVTIGGGAMVIKNVSQGATCVGVPAREL